MSTMRALSVESWGQDPTVVTLPKPTEPTDDSHIQLKVIAAGLPNLVRMQASGKHYTSLKTKLPYIPGSDGVGVTSSGDYLYFSTVTTGGAFAEYINVAKQAAFPIAFPDNTSEEEKRKIAIRIAGLVNPAFSSWMAFKARTANLRENFTVLINGATSISGQIAISHARALGAGKVIGLGRREDALKELSLDQYIVVNDEAGKTDFVGQLEGQHVDLILDYVYGQSTLELLQALPTNAPIAHDLETQYVQIGSLGGPEMSLPAQLLRGKNLVIRGAGPGAWSTTRDMTNAFPGLFQRLIEGVGEFEVVERGLEDVEETWKDKKTRSVFVM